MALVDQPNSINDPSSQTVKLHPDIEETVQGILEVIEELLASLEESTNEYGMVSPMLDNIGKAICSIGDPLPTTDSREFSPHQIESLKAINSINRTAQDMITKANQSEDDLIILANNLSQSYNEFSNRVRPALASTLPTVAERIKTTAQDFGVACQGLVKSAGLVQANPTDNLAKRDLVDNSRIVCEKANHATAALKAGAKGTQACIDAGMTVSGIISDLDTTIMFAKAGGGTPTESDGESFADYREETRQEAKAMVQATKKLVGSSLGDQETLANAANSSVKTMIRLAEVMKLGASTLGRDDPEGQAMLINAVKDIASALDGLVSAARLVSDDKTDKGKQSNLHESAKTMVMSVTSLLKTVKTVEDEALRGIRAAEATVDAIAQEVKILYNPIPEDVTSTPDELIRCTKQVTLATAKAVGAGNTCKQEDIVSASNGARQAVFQMLHACRGAANTAKAPELKEKTLNAGDKCANSFKSLMVQVHLNAKSPSPKGKQQLAVESQKVAAAVGDLVQAAEILRESNWGDSDDANITAENELLNAAKAIEAAAKKLSSLKPRAKAREADDSLTFEEQILEATKAIANATSVLVKTASHAQKQLVEQGKVKRTASMNSADGQWSRGLIASARKVASSTQSLCESAHSLVQGQTSQAKLVTSARLVSVSTAELLVACQAKGDIFGDGMKRLQSAGSAVMKATDNLVAAAQINEVNEAESKLGNNKEYGMELTGIFAKEVAAQEVILKKEKELHDAKKRLAMIKAARGGRRY